MMIWYVSSHGGVMAKKTPKQKINTGPSGTTMRTKRNTKDSVFTHLFSFPEYQLKMYQALHPEDTEVSESDIETITRKCVIAQHAHNDLGILIKDTLMVFVEAQSTWSVNVVIRLASYAIQSLTDYFRERDIYLYSSTKVECPRIELYAIFSCEREAMPETISLRDEFFPTGGCDLDVTVHVIQFDANKNDIINQYIAFCRVFDDLRKKYGYSPQTIRDTLCICRDKDILAEYVKKMENEIMNIMEYMFDQDNVTRLYGIEQMNLGRKEGREEGKIEGREEGKIEGREEGKIEGREEGKKEEKKATAINLLDMNIDVGVIEKATGLSQAEILKLKHH